MRELVLPLALAGLLALCGCIGALDTDGGPPSTTAGDEITNSSSMEDGTLVVSRASPAAHLSEVDCLWVGVNAVLGRLKNTSEGLEGVSVGTLTENGQPTLQVSRVTSHDRNGTIISRPSISHQRLVALSPEQVRVTVAANGRVEQCQLPVVLRNVSEEED